MIKTEHNGAKNGGGYHGRRKEAKTVCSRMRRRHGALLIVAALAALSGCSSTEKPASDLSGAGFIQLTPNAATRQFIIVNDRSFAEQVVVNRSACAAAPLCKK